MRLSWIVCAWIAGVSVAAAQPPEPTPAPPAPTPAPAPPTEPTPAPAAPAPAPAPEPAPAAKKQSAVLERARAEAKCARREPDCDWLGTLSSLERQSVARGLARRGYELEPSPWGKVIAEIRVYNEDVFAEKNRLLQFFNNFHVTTKEHAIRENVLISVGEVWDPLRVEETARRLRDPLWSSVVVVLPVKSAEPGKVDLLVVTRDIWSLRLNTQYTFQQGSLTNFSIALSENNFLGRRILFAWGLTLDQGTLSTGPVFLDRNLMGTNLQLRVDARVILNRENLLERLGFIDGPPTISEVDTPGFVREGSESSIALQRPLFLSSKWGVGVQFSHRYAIDRRFRGLGLLPVDCSRVDDAGAPTCEVPTTTLGGRTVVQPILDAGRDTMDGTILGVQYEMRHWDASASAVRQWGGQDLKHQLTVGHAVDSTRPRVLPSFPYAPGSPERLAFEREVLPRSEVTSTPFISYGLFTPSFRSLRNIDTYDLAEDVRFGLGFDASYSVGLEVLGSTRNFQRGSLSGSWTQPWCRDGFIRASAGISTRFQDSEFIDNTATGTLRFVSPTYRWARVVAQSSVGVRWNDTVSAALGFFSIGSANGLRGFQIAEFRGQRLLRNQIELRSLPIPVWVLRAGGVLFYDLGGAGDSLRDLQLHHNVGVGFRMLLPQTARELFRFDFAVPLDGDAAGAIRFIAGFESAF